MSGTPCLTLAREPALRTSCSVTGGARVSGVTFCFALVTGFRQLLFTNATARELLDGVAVGAESLQRSLWFESRF